MFAKAPIRRFNESSDSTPPLGTYDPRFETDLSISASCKGTFNRNTSSTRTSAVNLNTSNKEIFRSRPSSPSPASSQLRLRSASCHRSNAPLNDGGRRNTSQPPVKKIYRVPTFFATLTRECPTQTSAENLAVPLVNESENSIKNSEIPSQLEWLQNSLEEETKKTLALAEQNKTYENKVNLLQSEVDKHEQTKKQWEVSEKSYTDTIQLLQKSIEDLQQLLVGFQSKFMTLMDEKQMFKIQIANLEEEKLQLLTKDQEIQEKMKILQDTVQGHKDTLANSERKCLVLVENMNNCYQICEDKVANMEAEKAEWMKHGENLPEKSIQMQKEIDELRMSFESEKTRREIAEHELSESAKDSSDQTNETKAKITQLEFGWALKEDGYLKTIVEQEEVIKTLEMRSMDFARRASALKIEEINETRKLNKILQVEQELIRVQLETDKPSIENEVFEKSELCQTTESTSIPMMEIKTMSDVTINVSSEPDKTTLMDDAEIHTQKELVEPQQIPEDLKITAKFAREQFKKMQLKIALKTEKDNLKKQEQLQILNAIERENEILKEQVSVCSNKLYSTDKLSVPGDNIFLDHRSQDQEEVSTNFNADANKVEILSYGSNKVDTSKLNGSETEGNVDMVHLHEKSGKYPENTSNSVSSEISSPMKRSPRSSLQGITSSVSANSPPVSNRSRPHSHRSRGKIPGQSGGSTNMVTSYLDDVPEEDTN